MELGFCGGCGLLLSKTAVNCHNCNKPANEGKITGTFTYEGGAKMLVLYNLGEEVPAEE